MSTHTKRAFLDWIGGSYSYIYSVALPSLLWQGSFMIPFIILTAHINDIVIMRPTTTTTTLFPNSSHSIESAPFHGRLEFEVRTRVISLWEYIYKSTTSTLIARVKFLFFPLVILESWKIYERGSITWALTFGGQIYAFQNSFSSQRRREKEHPF